MAPQRILNCLLAATAGLCGCIGPNPEMPPPAAGTIPVQVPYAPPEPVADGYDWIQLKSGEWLKGELLDIHDDELSFDSKELDELTFDMEDVSVVRTAGVQTVHLENGSELAGVLLIEGEQVTLAGPAGGSVDRRLLLGAVPGAGDRRSKWKGKASASFTTQSGNTTQTDLSTYVFLRRQTADTRWDTTYNAAYSRTQGVETISNNRLNSAFDYFLTRRLFVTPLSVTAFQDKFSNIDLRLTPSARLGYDLFSSKDFSWELGGGPGFEYTRYRSVEADQAIEQSTAAALFTTQVEWDIVKDVDLRVVYSFSMPIPEAANYSHYFSALLSLEVFDWLDVDLSFIWDRINKPLPDDLGITPESNDFKTSIGFGVDF